MTFIHFVRVGFKDCDPAGILFFPKVFELYHESFEFFITEGLKINWNQYFQNSKLAFPIKHVECEYLKPIQANTKAQLLIRVDRIGMSSFTINCEISAEGFICAS